MSTVSMSIVLFLLVKYTQFHCKCRKLISYDIISDFAQKEQQTNEQTNKPSVSFNAFTSTYRGVHIETLEVR